MLIYFIRKNLRQINEKHWKKIFCNITIITRNKNPIVYLPHIIIIYQYFARVSNWIPNLRLREFLFFLNNFNAKLNNSTITQSIQTIYLDKWWWLLFICLSKTLLSTNLILSPTQIWSKFWTDWEFAINACSSKVAEYEVVEPWVWNKEIVISSVKNDIYSDKR